MIYVKVYSHPEFGEHQPISKWTKAKIVNSIGGRFGERWRAWSLEDLKTVLLEDGYQDAGTKDMSVHGHAKLYCLNIPKITMIEAAWMEGSA